MPSITFVVKDAAMMKRIEDAFVELMPIPQVVDEEDSSLVYIDKYTKRQWVKKKMIDYAKGVVRRRELEAAQKAIVVEVPEDALT